LLLPCGKSGNDLGCEVFDDTRIIPHRASILFGLEFQRLKLAILRSIFQNDPDCDRTYEMRTANRRWGFLAAMICTIILFAVPSRAEAHAGHGGQTPAVSVSVPASEHAVASEVSEPAAPILQLIMSAASQPAGKSASGCVSGCCDGVSHACCAFTLSDAPSDEGPIWIRARDYSATMPVPTGRDPTTLRKPPRTFA
jgi:hypothetical protein